jgi:hypothetical protein
MGILAGDDTLMGLIGAADNFGEPTPQINKPETILGLCISFTVRVACFRDWTWCGHESENGRADSRRVIDHGVDLCRVQVICEAACHQDAGVG